MGSLCVYVLSKALHVRRRELKKTFKEDSEVAA